MLRSPYFLFLGNAPDQLAAKTADGIAHWRRDKCVGQLRLADCQADVGLPDMTIDEAVAAGAKTFVNCVVNRGGIISPEWEPIFIEALEKGMDIANGLHNKVADMPAVARAARDEGREIFDVRHPTRSFPLASGRKRSGLRLLAVGTDCSVGKMYTALAIEAEMLRRGMKADFRATGQTGILIEGEGLSLDAIVADFMVGAIEWLTPDNDEDHWDVIEGQGSLFHPSYVGSTALLKGAQADALVMCHVPGRETMRGTPHYTLPDMDECIRWNEMQGSVTNRDCKVIAISCNTRDMGEADAMDYLKQLEDTHGMPAVDPVRTGVGRIVDVIVSRWPQSAPRTSAA